MSTLQQICSFVRRAVRIRDGLRWRRGGFVTPSESSVVEALREEDNISNRVVKGQDDLPCVSNVLFTKRVLVAHHCRQDALQEGTKDVEDISH